MNPEEIEKRLKACEEKLEHYNSIIDKWTSQDEAVLPENFPGVMSSVEDTISEIETIIANIS